MDTAEPVSKGSKRHLYSLRKGRDNPQSGAMFANLTSDKGLVFITTLTTPAAAAQTGATVQEVQSPHPSSCQLLARACPPSPAGTLLSHWPIRLFMCLIEPSHSEPGGRGV